MPSLKSTIPAALFCFAMVFCAASTNADNTYTYTGHLFSPAFSFCLPPLVGCFDSSTNFVHGSFTVASPLGDNLNENVVVNPKSYSFEAAGFTDTNLNVALQPFNQPPLFRFITTSSGLIEGWGVDVTGEFCCFLGDKFDIEIGSAFPDDFRLIFNGLDSVIASNGSGSIHGTGPFEDSALNFNQPGTWTVSTTGTNVPEPASGTLLIAGLVALAGLALKKSL